MRGVPLMWGALVVGAALGGVAATVPHDARALIVLAPFAIAAAIDVRTRRIPNALTLGATALVLAEAVLTGRGFDATAGYAAALGVGVALALVARGGFGVGDVKLLGAAGGAAGVSSLPALLFAVSLAGGVLAVVLLAVRHARGTTMPYGPAIAAGLLFSVAAT